LGDALRLPKRHPACRRREAQSGSGREIAKLLRDAKALVKEVNQVGAPIFNFAVGQATSPGQHINSAAYLDELRAV
jgi:hypothetical protein